MRRRPGRELRAAVSGPVLVAWVMVAACGNADRGGAAAGDGSDGTRVVLLGTGTPNAEPDRSGPAVAIVTRGRAYLVDAGPGIVRRANAAASRGIAALAPSKLNLVFLTHLHSDHTVGLPDLILTPWVLERREPLVVYGPPGTAAMASHLLQAYEQDIRVRLEGLEPANPTGYQVEAHDVAPGAIYRDSSVTVTAFSVHHGAWAEAYGYRFDTGDRVIVISGDAARSESIAEQCRGCDVLVHEVYAYAGWQRRSLAWQRYHQSAHTSAIELGQLAARAQPRLLVLYHELLWGTTPEALVKEVRSVWNGRVVYGRDLDVY